MFQAGSIAQKYNCQLTRLDFQQEEGLMSSLPLGLNQVEIERGYAMKGVLCVQDFYNMTWEGGTTAKLAAIERLLRVANSWSNLALSHWWLPC